MEDFTLHDLLNLSPEGLAKAKEEAIVQDTVKTLELIIRNLKEGKYLNIEGMLEYSPAGDCMGTDTHHINFCVGDMKDVVNSLVRLQNMQKGA